MNRNETLDSAKAAINRAPKSYGVPREHFERVARHWNAHLIGIGAIGTIVPTSYQGLKPEDVAIMLGQVKIARLEHDPQHEDSWCDLAGYAACGAEVSEVDCVVTYNYAPSYPQPRSWYGAPLYTDDMEVAEEVQEPAWKRAKVGDRIRIREGASNYCGMLPHSPVATVTETQTQPVGWRLVVGGNYVKNDDVLEILPPLPESKFGFTVGETVNLLRSKSGSLPGTVVGFSDQQVLVRWNRGKLSDLPSNISSNELRHGA